LVPVFVVVSQTQFLKYFRTKTALLKNILFASCKKDIFHSLDLFYAFKNIFFLYKKYKKSHLTIRTQKAQKRGLKEPKISMNP